MRDRWGGGTWESPPEGRRKRVSTLRRWPGAATPTQTRDTAGMMRWLLTYADMITLLLAFFIVMYSMSSLDVAKYRALATELKALFQGGGVSAVQAPPPASTMALDVLRLARGPNEAAQLEQVGQAIVQALKARGLAAAATVRVTQEGLEIDLGSPFFFGTGSADLSTEAREALSVVAGAIRDRNEAISVRGWADPRPIHTAVFPSNWELAGARATVIVRELASDGVAPSRMTATSYGDAHPVVPGDGPAAWQEQRRAEIILLAGGMGLSKTSSSGGAGSSPGPQP